MTEAAAAAERRIATIFRSWDRAGDGRISADGLRAVLLRLGVSEDHVQAIFTAADANRDGWIDYNEFLAWICGSDAHVVDVRDRLENPKVLAAVGVDGSTAPWRTAVVGGITDQELAELRAATRFLSKPTPVVRRAFEALYLILNVARNPSPTKAPSWQQVQRTLQDQELGERLRRFNLDALRAAPDLTAYLVQQYFGPGGASPPTTLANGAEVLTLRRVQRASRSAALLFQWSCRELINVGALLPPPGDGPPGPPEPPEPEPPEPEPPEPEPDPAELARQRRDREAPELSGDLAELPSRDEMVEPHQVLFQLMTGAKAEAAALVDVFKSQGPCDRCDGPHHALDCPHFGPHKGHKAWTPRSRGREDHTDAWVNLDKGQGDEARGPAEIVVSGRQVRQPGDGTCLYHSMSYGLRGAGLAGPEFTGHDLRRELADWCQANADEMVSGSSFREYIWWDHKLTVEAYCKRMREGGSLVWGGAIEIAACTRMYNVNVHVFVPENDTRAHASDKPDTESFRRIAAFGEAGERPTVAVTYMLRCHYDALVVESGAPASSPPSSS